MALASDLMGLGVSPLVAARTATGGIGPLTLSIPTTSIAAGGTKIGACQYLVSITSGSTGCGPTLPTVGTDSGAMLADDYIINNSSGTGTITLFASSGVAISVGASNTGSTTIPIHTTMTLYPISSTQWIGCKGT